MYICQVARNITPVECYSISCPVETWTKYKNYSCDSSTARRQTVFSRPFNTRPAVRGFCRIRPVPQNTLGVGVADQKPGLGRRHCQGRPWTSYNSRPCSAWYSTVCASACQGVSVKAHLVTGFHCSVVPVEPAQHCTCRTTSPLHHYTASGRCFSPRRLSLQTVSSALAEAKEFKRQQRRSRDSDHNPPPFFP